MRTKKHVKKAARPKGKGKKAVKAAPAVKHLARKASPRVTAKSAKRAPKPAARKPPPAPRPAARPTSGPAAIAGRVLRDVAIVSSCRTPVGRATKGSLKDTRPDTLAGIVMKEAMDRVPGLDPKELGDVVLGCAMPEAEQGMNVARLAAFYAGLPWEVAAQTVNRFCSSGLQSIAIAAACIAQGDYDAALAGGVESMSMVPMGGNKPSANPELFARHPEAYTQMGVTAENVAKRFGITRQMQDEFALASHKKAGLAQDAGAFDEQIVPVPTHLVSVENGRPVMKEITFARDECIRRETTLEGLARLKPVFDATEGSVTAGNSSPLNDGAGAVVLMALEKAEGMGLQPLGLFRRFAVAGTPPEIMGVGPVPAIRRLLEKTGLKVEDIDIFELNEAFAAQAAYCVRELGLPPERVNVNGGAIALGHPLGATGAVLMAKLLHEMKRRNARYGVEAMCIGGGMGAAALIERI